MDHEGESGAKVINNCMAVSVLRGATWQKSSYSNPCGSCVEVARLADGRIAVRNSRHPGGAALIYSRAEVTAFIHATTVGGFDDVAAVSLD